MFCINVMINLLLVAICATIVTGSDVWMALYSAEECLDSALLQDAVVAEGECVVGTLSDGSEVSISKHVMTINSPKITSVLYFKRFHLSSPVRELQSILHGLLECIMEVLVLVLK